MTGRSTSASRWLAAIIISEKSGTVGLPRYTGSDWACFQSGESDPKHNLKLRMRAQHVG
jgi:hypothetical protein